MHDCDVAVGDNWLRAHIDAYAQWAKSHNSLLVLTWDEDDDNGGNNQIATIIVGAGIKPGNYGERIDHYSVLRTIEDMYGLGRAGNSAFATPLTAIWAAAAGGGGGTGGGPKPKVIHHRSPIRLGLGRLSLRTLLGTRKLPVRVFRRTLLQGQSDRVTASGRARSSPLGEADRARLSFHRIGTHTADLRLPAPAPYAARSATRAVDAQCHVLQLVEADQPGQPPPRIDLSARAGRRPRAAAPPRRHRAPPV